MDSQDNQALGALLDRLDAMNEHLKAPTSSATIRVDSGSVATWVAVTAGVCSILVSSLFAIWLMFEVADLKDTDKLHRAYIDQLQKQVAK